VKRLLALVIVAAMATPASVAGAYDLSDDLAEISRRIEDINGQIATANASRTSVVADIVITRDALAVRQAELAATEAVLAETEDELAATQRDLESLQVQLQESFQALAETRNSLDESRRQARDLIRAAYVGTTDGRESVTFAADSVTSVFVGLQYLSLLAEDSDRAMLLYESLQTQEERQQVRIEAEEVEVAEQIAELEAVEEELAALASVQTDQAAAVATELANLNAKLDAVEDDIAEFADELDGLEEEQARVERLIEEEASRAGDAPGVLVRPVPGAITSSFGMRLHPILGYSRMHTGVDMSAGHGQEINAGGSGRVILAGFYGGYGNTVIIDHGGGMTTLYAHQSQLGVSYGDQVDAGQLVGYVGTSGLSTGAHLHFEVRLLGRPVDPTDYI
jgi:murein DD-endopeptidase MepM/ murein hydrolase activator NlpD